MCFLDVDVLVRKSTIPVLRLDGPGSVEWMTNGRPRSLAIMTASPSPTFYLLLFPFSLRKFTHSIYRVLVLYAIWPNNRDDGLYGSANNLASLAFHLCWDIHEEIINGVGVVVWCDCVLGTQQLLLAGDSAQNEDTL